MTSNEQILLRALKYLVGHYVGMLEHGRDRIVQLGGDCDPVDVMERGDTNLRQVSEIIASVECSPVETESEQICEIELPGETHNLRPGVVCIACWNRLMERILRAEKTSEPRGMEAAFSSEAWTAREERQGLVPSSPEKAKAEPSQLEERVRWVLNDAAYKPPEAWGEMWGSRWAPILRDALNGNEGQN